MLSGFKYLESSQLLEYTINLKKYSTFSFSLNSRRWLVLVGVAVKSLVVHHTSVAEFLNLYYLQHISDLLYCNNWRVSRKVLVTAFLSNKLSSSIYLKLLCRDLYVYGHFREFLGRELCDLNFQSMHFDFRWPQKYFPKIAHSYAIFHFHF